MRWSNLYIPTLKEAPAEAEVISHKLLIRAGMIRKVTSGIYVYMPLGLRTLNKAAAIVREEMNRSGAQELLMPMIQPADLWQESGRWDFYGKELLRIKDRHDRDYCLGPTHEEVITDLVRGEMRSYRQLPVNLYQIQTKIRDEIRPRFGLMRGREFLMKDAYSFDRDEAGLDVSYRAMYEAYKRIFTRMGLKFRPVEADSGSIGGNCSCEFMVLAETGEDTIAFCHDCDYAANVERAQIKAKEYATIDAAAVPAVAEISTPNAHTIEELTEFLHVPANTMLKTLLFVADGKAVAAIVRGDRELNEVKLKNLLKADTLELASPEQVEKWTHAPVGFAGPIGLDVEAIYADFEAMERGEWIVGANKKDTHLEHVCLSRDCKIAQFADLRMITEEDICPVCGGKIGLAQGIEVGHVFKLGTKYSEAMGCKFLDEDGKEKTMIMGCYGIGVSRVVASCIEQNNDEHGIVFPPPLAPFEVLIMNLDSKDETVNAKADEIYAAVEANGLDVLLDDRQERPGIKFKDGDLVGIPLQLIIGGKGLARGIIEAKDRRSGEKAELPVEGFAEAFAAWKAKVYAGWNL